MPNNIFEQCQGLPSTPYSLTCFYMIKVPELDHMITTEPSALQVSIEEDCEIWLKSPDKAD